MTEKTQSPSDAELQTMCAEIIAWQETGALPGNALRDYAQRSWAGHHDALQMAERDVATAALKAVARWGAPPQAQEPVADDLARDLLLTTPHVLSFGKFDGAGRIDAQALSDSIREFLAAPPSERGAVAGAGVDALRWCGNCGEGVTFFCRSKTVGECPMNLGRIVAHGITHGGGNADRKAD